MRTKMGYRWLAAVALMAPLSTMAADGDGKSFGFYVGGGVGASKHDVSQGSADGRIFVAFGDLFVTSVPRDSVEADTDSTGWRGFVGYRFNRHVAAEFEYLDFGTSKVHEIYTIDLPFGGSDTIEQNLAADVTGPAFSLRGILPIGSAFDLYARAGLLFADMKTRRENAIQSTTFADKVLYGGLGADWHFASHWSARLEYERSKEIEKNIDLAGSHVELSSLSVVYRF